MTEPASTRQRVDHLDDLERRVGRKWAAVAAARTPQWKLPDVKIDMSDWSDAMKIPLPPGTLQFPREQWASYPAKRTLVLILIDHALDLDMTDEQWIKLCWLMHYGGKIRLS